MVRTVLFRGVRTGIYRIFRRKEKRTLREAEITNVAVEMEYRRRHIAEALVAEMQKEAAGRGTHSIFLEVRCSNTGAIALYQKMGFSICGTRRGFYEKPKEDAYVMVYTPEISTTTGED